MSAARSDDRLNFAHADDPVELGDIVFVAVGTPATTAGSADLRAVRGVLAKVQSHAAPGTLVVMKSTVPPGTGRDFARSLSTRGIGYASNPEFLREGSAVRDWFETDRIVIGGTRQDGERLAALYADVDAPKVLCDITSAEMIKYASNAFLATKISFVNEIAVLCDLVGANIDEVARAIGMDARIGPAFLRPGIGYGGSCFPKDTRALDFIANLQGYDFHLLRAVIDVNARQRLLPVRALKKHFGALGRRRIAVLGLTFKPETDDVRESPAVEVVAMLQAEGADVIGYNPIPVNLPDALPLADSLLESVTGADAAVLMTEWSQIVEADWRALVGAMRPGAVVFDGRNALDPAVIRGAGAHYIGVGRPDLGVADRA
jgi:UDPglucose 6-dehydrogenase